MGTAHESPTPQPDSPAPAQPSLYFDKPCPQAPFSSRWAVCIRREERGQIIMSVNGDSAEDATKRAHIASAAHSLYAACKEALTQFEYLQSLGLSLDGIYLGLDAELKSRCDELRTALALAEGGGK